jgi:predicted ArsR family transcriptional regulator
VNDIETDVLTSPTRRAIMGLLQEAGNTTVGSSRDDAAGRGLSAGDTAAALGLHVTTARFHLERMVAAGAVVTAQRRGSVGRPRKLYLAAAAERPALASPEALQAFTELLTKAWADSADGSPGDPERAGEQWVEARVDGSAPPAAASPGAWLGKVGMAVDLLDEWGYQPELRTSAGGRTVELTLQGCPFLSMARAHPDVVCGVHRGLLRGTMAAVGENGTDVDLQPFVTERSCVARLTTSTAWGRHSSP